MATWEEGIHADESSAIGGVASPWIGILASAGTPGAIIDTLSKAINEALKADDVANQLRLQDMELMCGNPEEFALRIKGDTARWDAVLQAAHLRK